MTLPSSVTEEQEMEEEIKKCLDEEKNVPSRRSSRAQRLDSRSGNRNPSLSKSHTKKKKKNNNDGVEVDPHIQKQVQPLPSQLQSGTGSTSTATTSTRRIFTAAFKLAVLEAYNSDLECIGNQRATARKFGIHRRQVQKWLTQMEKEGEGSSPPSSSSSSSEAISNSAAAVVGNTGTSFSTSSPRTLLDLNTNPFSDKGIHNSEDDASSPSQIQKDFKVEEEEEPVTSVTDLKVDPSPPSSSTSSTKSTSKSRRRAVGGSCGITGSAMSVNPSHTPNPTGVIVSPRDRPLPVQSTSQEEGPSPSRSHQGSSHTIPTPNLLSPDSLLSRFYALYASGHPGSLNLNYLNYPQGSNPDLSRGPSTSTRQSRTTPQPPRNPNHSNYNKSSNYHNLLDLDEIAAIHPNNDYSLLRHALLRNEITFTKLPESTPKSTFGSPESSEGEGWGNNGKNPLRTCSSPSSTQSSINSNLALEILRHHAEYLRLMQQAGLSLPGLDFGSSVSTEGGTGSSPPKYPWLNPLTHAAAAIGLPIPGLSNINGLKKPTPPPASHQHVFLSPKPPPSNAKPKTVAAALAASRGSPNSLMPPFPGLEGTGKKRPPTQRRRGKSSRQTSKPSCTITRPSQMYDEYQNPSSMMLDLSTSVAAAEGLISNLPNGISLHHSAALVNGGTHFLSSLMCDSETPNHLESLQETADVRKYWDMPQDVKSPMGSGGSDQDNTEQLTKAMALEAFAYDPEVAGDSRAVARKFRLNARVVMKWIKENSGKAAHFESYTLAAPVADLEQQTPDDTSQQKETVTLKSSGDVVDDEEPTTSSRARNPFPPSVPTSSNKRKTSKPNQICDFQRDDDDEVGLGFGDVPAEMIVPIKKRRVSSQD